MPLGRWPAASFVLVLLAIHALGMGLRVWGDATVWQGRPMLISADGYAFAAGIRAAVEGLPSRWLAPGDSALVALGWLVAKLTPLSIESFAHAFPAVIGPAIAWPIAFIGRAVGRDALGIVAALLAVAAPGYLGRTAAGYFDTDLFALTVPLSAVAAWLAFVHRSRRERVGSGALAAGLLAAAPWFYEKARSLGLALALCAALYLVIRHRRDPTARAVIAGVCLSQIDLPNLPRIALAALVPIVLASRSAMAVSAGSPAARRVLAALPWLLALAGLVLSPAWLEALAKLSFYASAAPGAGTASSGPGLLFDATEPSISELRPIGLAELGARVSGLWPLAVVAALGAGGMVWRCASLVVLAPFGALGFFALAGGARFAIYLTPVAALGLAWVTCAATARLRWRPAVSIIVTGLVLTPSVARDLAWHRRPVFAPAELEAFDALAARVRSDDMVIGWWDDGYPIAFLTGADPLIDGGRRGRDANLVAELLVGDSQPHAATLARALAEHARARVPAADAVLATTTGETLADRLASLRAPPATRDVYVYLPARLLWMLPTIASLRPHDGERPTSRVFGPVPARLRGGVLEAGRVQVDPRTATVIDAGRREHLAALYRVGGSGASRRIEVVDGDPRAPTTGYFLPALGVYLELDRALARSVLVQLLVFEQPETDRFELVFANDAARVYRVAR